MRVMTALLWGLLTTLIGVSIMGLIALNNASRSASNEVLMDAMFHAGLFVSEIHDLHSKTQQYQHEMTHSATPSSDELSFCFDMVYARLSSLTHGDIYAFIAPAKDARSYMNTVQQLVDEIEKHIEPPPVSSDEVEELLQLIISMEAQSKRLHLEISRFSQRASNRIGNQIIKNANYALYSFIGTLLVGFSLFLSSIIEYQRRTRVTNKLLAVEGNYRTLFGTSTLPIFTVDRSGYITDANDAMCGYLQLNKNQVLGTYIMDRGEPSDINEYKSVMKRIIDRTATTGTFKWKYTSDNGAVTYWEIICTGIYDENQECQGGFSVCKDITDKLKAENALLESNKRSRAYNDAFYSLVTSDTIFCGTQTLAILSIIKTVRKTLELQHCSVWLREKGADTMKPYMLNKDTALTSCQSIDECNTKLLLSRLGESRTEMIGCKDVDYDLKKLVPEANQGSALLIAIKADDALCGFILAVKKTENASWGLNECSFLLAMRTLVETVLEANRRRASQLELKAHKDQLETLVDQRTSQLTETNMMLSSALSNLEETGTKLVHAEKLASLGSLVAGISHEINTPLGNSITVVTTLEEKTKDFYQHLHSDTLKRSILESYVEDTQTAIALLTRNLADATRMVQSFKRVSIDQTSSIRRKFDCKEFTEEILVTLRPLFKKSKIKCKLDIPDGLVLDSYPGDYSQIISNLCINAVTHAFDEGQGGLIKISGQRKDDLVEMKLSDNGKGIPPEHQKNIFDPFFTTKFGQGGSGLGLSIAYNITNGILGGEISVTSPPGEGTTFTLLFPICAPNRINQDN